MSLKAIRLLVFILIFCISSLRADNPSASSRFDFDFDAPATAPVLGRAIASAGGAVGAAAGAAVPTSRPGLEPQPCSPKPICPSTPRTSYAQDGTCNNLVDGGRGSVDRPFRRLLPPAYADRTGSPRVASNGGELPSPRLVSTTMAGSMTSSSSASSVLPFWGQYIVHDIANTPTIIRVPGVNCRCDRPDPDCINIEIPRTDVQFTQDRRTCLPVVRSHPVQDAHCNPNIRQQKNEITSYLDAGNVYGNSQSAFDDMINQNSAVGELKIGELAPHGSAPANAPTLPLTTQVGSGLGNSMVCPRGLHKPRSAPCFAAGDHRANENSVLTSFHTLFLRLHNTIVNGLNVINPSWNKQRLAQTAKSIVAAMHQRITYKQYLPIILGSQFVNRYGLELLEQGYSSGYDASFDATVINSFAAAAFRFGHSQIPSQVVRRNQHWAVQGSPIRLRDSFFNSNPLLTTNFGGANSILRGVTNDAAQKVDPTFVDDLHDFLFAPAGRRGHDLLAINLARGRDHGLPSYNEYRELFGLKKATRFSDFTEIPATARQRLQRVYSNVNDVDLYIGGLSETPVRGGSVGPTFAHIIAYQFRSLKRGDRFWHENGGSFTVFTPAQLAAIRSFTLSKIMCENLHDQRTIQPNPFLRPTVRSNSRVACSSFPDLNLQAWRENSGNAVNTRTSPELTQWFVVPFKLGNQLTGTALLNDLLVQRPDDVCTKVLGTEERTVQGNKQIRFKCPPGSIRGTDFPKIESDGVIWTDWEDNSTPRRSRFDDDETRDSSHVCVEPIAIQAQTLTGTPARETGDVFKKFSPFDGLQCFGSDQTTRRCQDYRVRYLCRSVVFSDPGSTVGPPTTTTPTTTTTTTRRTTPSSTGRWSRWISVDNPLFGSGDNEYLFRVRNLAGFCQNPTAIQARVVGTHLSSKFSGDTFYAMNSRVGLICRNYQQISGRCKNYEVRYFCRNSSINRG